MGMMTAFAYLQWLKDSPIRTKALGLPDTDSSEERGPGRPEVLTRDIKVRFVELIDREKRLIERRDIESDWRYGDRCTDVQALRSFMQRQYRERLIAEGVRPEDATRRAEEYAATSEFEQKLRSHKVSLSRARRLS